MAYLAEINTMKTQGTKLPPLPPLPSFSLSPTSHISLLNRMVLNMQTSMWFTGQEKASRQLKILGDIAVPQLSSSIKGCKIALTLYYCTLQIFSEGQWLRKCGYKDWSMFFSLLLSMEKFTWEATGKVLRKITIINGFRRIKQQGHMVSNGLVKMVRQQHSTNWFRCGRSSI